MKVKIIILSLLFLIVTVFFKDVFLQNKLPIPADTIVGLYHPYIDFYSPSYPRGIPFKNFLITDPVRQQYPWKNLVIEAEKNLELPLWNPYTFTGTPLLANFQSAPFSIFNLTFFVLPFTFSWVFYIYLQPLLMVLFMFLYLNNLKLNKTASIFGSIVFAFSGFSIAWMQWGIILTTVLWTPLIFLSIDKIVASLILKNKKQIIKWVTVYVSSLILAFFAGHLQAFFYVCLVTILYFIFKILINKIILKGISMIVVSNIIFTLITSVFWIPVVEFVTLSARSLDQANWNQEGWFIPWQNLIQFISPDFFGNPATLNYFGKWNYAEFVGYAGVSTLFLIILSIFRKDKKTLFFWGIIILSIIFAYPSIIAKIPFKFSIPFLSTSQPTRLMFLIDLSVAILSALGFDYLVKIKNKKIILFSIIIPVAVVIALWLFVAMGGFSMITMENLIVARRNLIFPSILIFITAFILILFLLLKEKKYLNILMTCLIVILVFDLFRFGWKFLPFTNIEYLYPTTRSLDFIQKNIENFRIMSTDSRILPPNFSIMYKIQSIDGYDPLFLNRYAQLIAAIGRDKPDISAPYGFNRIITLQNYHSPLIDLLNVKYILTLEELKDNDLRKVFQEGALKIYENLSVMNKVFFAESTVLAQSRQQAIEMMFDVKKPIKFRSIVEGGNAKDLNRSWSIGKASIENYSSNNITINTINEKDGFLVLTDSFYPTWKAYIDGKEVKIYLTNFNFRGIVVPKGKHSIEFKNSLF